MLAAVIMMALAALDYVTAKSPSTQSFSKSWDS
jgi:hypothetical protein